MNSVIAKPPADFSLEQIDDFINLVLAGGEVAADGLRGRITRAKCIAFIHVDDCPMGVAGLKQPDAGYRERVQRNAKFALSEDAFPFELGWVYLDPSARGKKLSLPLCKPVIAAAGNSGVFATSRSANVGMHGTLLKLGFERVGTEWPSNQNRDDLVLFVRNAP